MSIMLWQPSQQRIQDSNLTAFRHALAEDWQVKVQDYPALYRWSIEEPEQFWCAIWSFARVIAERQGKDTLKDGDKMPGAQWFPQARLNFAQNLLRRRDDAQAIVFRGEDKVRRSLTYAELYTEVSQLAQFLRELGVTAGDRVAGFMPNMPETVMAMLAAASLGAIWSSCSPDFGVQGVLDRFGQIEPKVLFSADGYFYNGKTHDCLAKLEEITARLPGLKQLVVVPYTRPRPSLERLPGARLWPDCTAPYTAGEIPFAQLPFNHPLYIMSAIPAL
jgi:acetoacetyl-CoA synthetase